jgi:hypothetical protein
MYSPTISPALIPRLYRLGKALDMPMTRLVNQLLEQGIERLEQGAEQVSDPPAPPLHRESHTQGRPRKPRRHTAREGA